MDSGSTFPGQHARIQQLSDRVVQALCRNVLNSATCRNDSREEAPLSQLLAAAAVSFGNFVLHAIMTGLIVIATRHTASLTDHLSVFFRVTALLIVTTTALTCAHVAEIGMWAGFYAWAGISVETVSAFEFAFENYTALGYGDAIPATGHRVIGPITALNGLLLIGWSVAIIFEVLRMAEIQIGRLPDDGVGRRNKSDA